MSKGTFQKMLCFVIAVILLASCAAVGSLSPSEPLIPVSVDPSSVIINDHLGRTIEIDGSVERIVSGYYISGSMLLALGLGDRLVAVEAKADSRPIYGLSDANILSLPNVGSAKQFELEACIAQDPDLVILPIRLTDVISALEALGINVIAINPEDDERLKEAMEMLATATGTSERYQQWLEAVSNVTQALSSHNTQIKKRVYMASNSDLLSTATAKMYQHTQIQLAGGENVAADLTDSYWANISYEQLLSYDPDVIILPPAAGYTVAEVYENPALSSLWAVANRQVYAMPDAVESWDSPVPLAICGAQWLRATLYPELYSYDEFITNTIDLYKTFYDIEVTEEMLIS